jgi:uncharacterized protein YjiS (DUF1127 family)
MRKMHSKWRNKMKTIIEKISKVLEQNREAIALRRRYYKTYDELSRLNDRDLADIGINRSMIDQIAFDHTYNTSR